MASIRTAIGCAEFGCVEDADECDRTTAQRCDRSLRASSRPYGLAQQLLRPRELRHGRRLRLPVAASPIPIASQTRAAHPRVQGRDACENLQRRAGAYGQCATWTCDTGFGDSECDCGCNALDPRCRQQQRLSCTEPGCELTTCEQCTDDTNDRAACGGEWLSDDPGDEAACDPKTYDLDGLCDCGCGVEDPDCGGEGCTDDACHAVGCDVCHEASNDISCLTYTCSPETYGTGDGCNCGCGALDRIAKAWAAKIRLLTEAVRHLPRPFGRSVGCL